MTFSEIVPPPPGTPLTNQYAAFGVTFANAFIDGQGLLFPNVNNPGLTNFDTTGFPIVNPVSIFFNDVLSEAAFAIVTNQSPPDTTFEAYLNGNLVESFTAPTDVFNPNNFFGFTGIAFNEIRVSGGGINNALAIDNIQLGPQANVPEPATMAIFGGLAVAGIAGYRRKQAAA